MYHHQPVFLLSFLWQKNVQIKIKVQFYRFNRYYSSDGRYFILALCPRVLDKLFEKDVLWEYYDRVAKLEDQKLTLKKNDIKYNIGVSLERHPDNIDTDVKGWKFEGTEDKIYYSYKHLYFHN